METIQRSGLWHVTLAQRDLVEQGGLDEDNFEYEGTHFTYKERKVIMSHIYDQHLVVSLEGQEDNDLEELMRGFSKFVGYQPFCKYLLNPSGPHPPLPTYEWDKIDPEGRFLELSKKPNIESLSRV